MYEWILLAIGFLLIGVTGLFVASEFALVNLDRAELEARRSRGVRGLDRTISALRITSTHLSGAQLGITLTTLLTGFTMEPAISQLLRDPLLAWGLPSSLVPGIGAVLGVTIATFLSMILGELVPKNFALAIPLATARVVVPFQAFFTAVTRPVITVLNGSANGVLRALGLETREELSGARTAEELSSLVRRSSLAGALESDTATLLDRTLRFADLTAADVMTPRPRIVSVKKTDVAESVIERAKSTGYSRFPVVGDSIDDVVGIVHVKQAVAVPREKRAIVPVTALKTDGIRVPDTIALDRLLTLLREHSYQVAVVVDEYGGTAGVATLEDLVEEIVGDVADEHDRARADVVVSGNSVTFPGIFRPDELSDRTGITIPQEGHYETIAGFMIQALGRLPESGDEVPIADGVLRVERLEGRRIDRIRFTLLGSPRLGRGGRL